LVLFNTTQPATANQYYVDSQLGADNNPGSIGLPWKSVNRVNQAALSPGDSVLFRRGCSFRGQLVAASGNASANITYGAYGTGSKPLFLGSVDRSDSSQWTNEGGNIWSTGDVPGNGMEMLANPSFNTDLSNWNLFTDGISGADATPARTTLAGEYDSAPAGCKITCASSNGNAPTSIICTTQDISLQAGQWYVFRFRAKASTAFSFTDMPLLRFSTYDLCSDFATNRALAFTPSWQDYRIYYHASKTVTDARVFFLLGQALPVGGAFYFDSASFQACNGTPLAVEVGNLIFNNEASCGTKQQHAASLTSQGNFWYDNNANLLKLYSMQNPGQAYSRIECASNVDHFNLNDCSYAIFENLDLRYGGAHGMNGTNVQHVVIRDCDFSFIGGGQLFGYASYVRYGNAVQFWENAHDCWVQRCRIDQIYDTGITNQGSSTNQQYNLYYQDNVITNCHWSIEIWNQPAASTMTNIYVENNTCLNAGFGWSYPQRAASDQYSSHLAFFFNPSTTTHLVVRNNILSTSKFCLLFGDQTSVPKAVTDYNCFFQPSGTLVLIFNSSGIPVNTYTPAQFAQYQTDSGHDSNSVFGDPQLGASFAPVTGSRCIDTGFNAPNVTQDFLQNARPAGIRMDIGALEFIPSLTATPTSTTTPALETTSTPTPTPIRSAWDAAEMHGKPFLAFPNPARNTVNFLMPALDHDAGVKIVLYNLAGEIAGKLTAQLVAGSKQVIIWDGSKAAPGIYIVRVSIDGKAHGEAKIALLK
jgi:hypothetical protein